MIASLAVGMGQGPVLLATVAVLAASGGVVMDAVFALVLPLPALPRTGIYRG